MDERTQIFIEKVAEALNSVIDSKDIDVNDLLGKGLSVKELTQVLNLNSEPVIYDIKAFVRVLSALNIHMELMSMEDQNNWDLLGDGPSEN